jgi:hypothetical protein
MHDCPDFLQPSSLGSLVSPFYLLLLTLALLCGLCAAHLVILSPELSLSGITLVNSERVIGVEAER